MTEEFNDYIDKESEEYAYQDFKQSADKQAQHLQRWQYEKNQEASQADQNKIFTDALKDAGVSQERFNELVAMDPQGTREVFQQGVKEYVSKVASQARGADGRYLPGKPQAQQRAPETARSQQNIAADSRQKLDALHEKAKGRSLSYEEELSVIDALFDSDTPL